VEELVEEDAQCPDIDFVIIDALKNHLWSHVFIRPTKCCTLLSYVCSRPSEITHLYAVIFVNKQILWLNMGYAYLDISVHDIVTM
jgi:hypothetical protein